MVANISRDELRTRMDRGDPLILLEVLAPQYYRHSHLPGALNLPPGKVAEAVQTVMRGGQWRVEPFGVACDVTG